MKNFRISLWDNKSYSPFQLSIRFYLLFIILFSLGRTLFLFHHFDLINEESNSEIFSVFKNAIRLDLSAASFLFVIPFIIILLNFFIRKNFMYHLFRWVVFIISIIIILLQIGDIILYEEWQNKLNYKAIIYLWNPKETLSYVSWNYITAAFILLLVQCSFFYYFFRKWFHKNTSIENKSITYKIIYSLFSVGMIFLLYRGGFQSTPINTSFCYFSKNQSLNDASTNTIWYLAQSIYENKQSIKQKPFQFYKTNEAKKTVDEMYVYPKDSTECFLSIKNPNIIIVVLESYCADVMKGFNGSDSCTPNLDYLVKNGVSFQNCYAPGWRSDMGLSSILSAVSCIPDKAISSQPAKYHGLSSLPKSLKDKGYFTSFLYGGPAEYGNLKSFYYWHKFDKIKDQSSIKNKYPVGKLGIHDEGIFAEAIEEVNSYKKPFCTFVYTLSSHPPFDIPMEKVFTHGGVENQYINSIYYTDKCVGTFMENCKKQSWYDSTLFVFIADHGHATPTYKQWDYQSHRIPLIFYGNVIKPQYKSFSSNKIISETDLSATLLAQLNIPYDTFIFSKDAMNPYCPSFAPYIINNGYGMITDKGIYSYNYFYNKIEYESIKNPADRNNLILQCKSYIQRTFDFFDGL
jgi:phosphoglycerol transferase MdoB-like AlkP superfamily enzyme